jgi:hypothetical protein
LLEALIKRNFLVHHFFREMAEDFISQDGRNRMLAELEGIEDVLKRANDLVSRIYMASAPILGISVDSVEAQLKTLLESPDERNGH